jgi:putative ABC transport system permease protein
MTNDVIGWSALAGSLVFVLLSVLLTRAVHLSLERSIVVAVARSLVQMLIVGAALVPIVDPDTPLAWSWLWVAGIIVFASLTVARRAPEVPGMFTVALAAHTAVAVVGLSIVYGLSVFELEGRTLVPVAGMVVGNSMKGAVVAANRVAEAVAEHRPEIEAGLALGMTTRAASRRFVRSALRTAISPQIEQTAALGLVFLPGAMTGLILAGADPLGAVRAQLALMYVILAGVVIAATATGIGAIGRLSTPDQRLRRVTRQRVA